MDDMENKINKLWGEMYGNPETGDIGMKQMVKEIHEILMWFKGWRVFLIIIVMIAGALTTIKGLLTGWITK